MLDIFEKISIALCGLVVLAVGAGYLVFGVRSAVPIEFVAPVPDFDVTNAVSQGTPTSVPGIAAESTRKILESVDQGKIRENLRKNGVNAGRIESYLKPIPASTFEFARAEANWMPELRKYSSSAFAGSKSRLVLTGGVDENTLFHKLGLRNEDVVELVDGEIIEFDERSALRYRSMYYDALERLESGGAVTVTISRKGQPMNLIFTLPK